MRKIALMISAALLALAGSAHAAPEATYAPPYALGPQTGDRSNTVVTDADAGRMTVVRHYTTPGAFNCGGNGPQVDFRVTHVAQSAVGSVTVEYEAATDNFTWVRATVTGSQSGNLGYRAVKGPHVPTRQSLVVEFAQVHDGVMVPVTAVPGETLTIDFGLQVASACPNVNGGTVSFPSVTVG